MVEGLAISRQNGDRSVRDRVDTLRTQLQLDIPHFDDLARLNRR